MATMKTKSRVTFVIEYDSTDERNAPIIKHALEYLALLGDGITSNEFHDIPGTGSKYEQRRPTRVLWNAEHGVIDWTSSKSDLFEVEKKHTP